MLPERPSPPANAGAFIGGIVAGFFAGGTFLTLVALLIAAGILALVSIVWHPARDSNLALYICSYIVPAGTGIGALFLVRRNVGFLSGFVVGLTAGMLGGVTLCNGIIFNLNNTH